MYKHINRLANLYNHDAVQIMQRNAVVIDRVADMIPHSLIESSIMAQVIDSPVMRSIQRQETFIQSILNNPVLEAIQRHDSIVRNAYDSPAIEAIRSQERFIQKTLNHPVINSYYQHETALQTFFNSYDSILKQHSIWNQLSAKPLFTSSFSTKTLDLAIEKFESLYKDIQKKEVKKISLQEINEDEAKESLKETIFSIKKLKTITNTLDSKMLWKILDRTATIFGIYSFLFGGLSNAELNFDLNVNVNININININDSDNQINHDIHLDGVISPNEDKSGQNINPEVIIDPGVRG